MIKIPKLYKIEQRFNTAKLQNIEKHLNDRLEVLAPTLKPGMNIAIAIGSRGIANQLSMLTLLVQFLKEHKTNPFIVPAMGSHGGATALGQKEVLSHYNISELSLGIPVISNMETVEIGKLPNDCPVCIDKEVFNADGAILLNRIKPHTSFHATYESGLVKMMVVGLGKHKQALEVHKYGVEGLKAFLGPMAEMILKTGKILGGIAVVENAYDETLHVEVLSSDKILCREPELLRIAKQNMPQLPVKDIDVLIVDRMGKNISGVGMDPNIIGRLKIFGQEEPCYPRIHSIIVQSLTPETGGNATGVGLADVITKELYNQINFKATYENVYTSTFLERAKIPIVAKDMEEAFHYAIRGCGYIKPGDERIVKIKDTLSLDYLYVSQKILKDLECDETIQITGDTLIL